MNDRTIRWIIGSAAAALWISTILTLAADIHDRWHLAILLAACVASLAGTACVLDARAQAREAHRSAERRAALDQIIAAVDQHAGRMEKSVFTAERWMANGWRAERLAQHDAAEARAAQRGDETGPLPMIFNGLR